MFRSSTCILGLFCLIALIALAPRSVCAQDLDKSANSTFVGVWNATAQTDNGEQTSVWTFKQAGKEYSGTYLTSGSDQKRELQNIQFDGKELKFEFRVEFEGKEYLTKVASHLDGNKLDGNWSLENAKGKEKASGNLTAVNNETPELDEATEESAETDSVKTPDQSRPNILLIMTDQHAATALSCVGNRDLKTPTLDQLAAEGVRFNRAYVTQPLCLPCRSSLQTARYPHEIGTISNGRPIGEGFPLLGNLVNDAGYESAYVGKWHVGTTLEQAGYSEAASPKRDRDKSQIAAEFLTRERDKPFFLTVSYLNPHNVCQLARGQALPDGPIGKPPTVLNELPVLPDNFEVPENEPTAIRKIQASSPYHYPTKDWDELKWRQYMWGYYRLVEKVDTEIGSVIRALDESGQRENTVIIFVSDHGEGVAMHQWNQKQILYEQSVRVPFLISWRGKTKPRVTEMLSSVSLDIPTTILDFAGTEKPESMRGMSLKEFSLGGDIPKERDFVVAETMFARGDRSLGLVGRMIRTKKYKYCVYDVGQQREQLFDMDADPGEIKNLVIDERFRDEVNRHRALITKWARQTMDSEFPYVKPE